MAITVLGARRRLHRMGLRDCLPEQRFEQLLSDAGVRWRRRVLTPAVVIRLFILQVLCGNVAINALRQLSGDTTRFSAAAFCKARRRLPLWALSELLRELVNGHVPEERPRASRVFVVDGSSVSLADTPSLRKRFGLPSNQQPGVGYPQASIVGLLDLVSGLFTRLVVHAVFTHDLRGAVRVHAALRAGDVLLADRAFAGFAHLALLSARGIGCVFRIGAGHRDVDGATCWRKRGRRKLPPPWLDAVPAAYRDLCESLDVRIVSYPIEQPGYRSRVVRLVTTLLDEQRWSDRQLRELYARRWEIETAFGHAKTTLGMATPRCRTAEGVMRELAVYLIAYNLIRLQMLAWAQQESVDVRRVSFIDATRYLLVLALGLRGVATPILNPARPGRRQLRVLRRRPKHYPLLTKPREQSDINHDPRRR
jgi:hypothetical protein